jgi:chromosome partitioning protein
VVITMHDERTRLAQDVERELRDHFSDLVLRTVIPRNIRVAEAPSFGIPVVQHAPSSHGSAAYRELASELAERERADRVSVERGLPVKPEAQPPVEVE